MLFAPYERWVALRYMRARRQEGFISVISWSSLLGIGLGVATLIIVMAVMNGFRAELFTRILGMNGHVHLMASAGPLQNWEDVAARALQVPDVRSAAPLVEGQALVTNNGLATGALVRGVDPADFRNRPLVASHLVAGAWEAFTGEGVAIGARLARRLNVGIGDSLTLVAPGGRATVFGTVPRLRAFKVAVIFDVGMYEYDSGFVFMPLPSAQAFFHVGQGVTALDLFVTDPHALGPVREALTQAFTGEDLYVTDWRQSNAGFFNALQVERNVMFLILTLIILVAAFNIISGLIMLVKDKGHDIAILRTMGASRGAILRIFFLTGASIGTLGTALGVGLGVVIATNIEHVRQFFQALTGTELFAPEIYFLSHLPALLDWSEVGHVALMALSLSFLATLYPAWRAARLDPVEALRYE